MENLSHLAFKSENTFGRALSMELDRDRAMYDLNPFFVDWIKISRSKAFRRLRNKTQVIAGNKNAYIRDRLIHSFDVADCSCNIGVRLALNHYLLLSSSLSHDLGHVPVGHFGERYIANILGENFRHERFVIFVLEMIERNGVGLNLSYEVLQAIRYHSRNKGPMVKTDGLPLEADSLMFSDKIAYTITDFNDAQRYLSDRLLAPDEVYLLGNNQSERMNACITALCKESLQKDGISFSESRVAKDFKIVRDFMYEDFYSQVTYEKQEDILNRVVEFFENYFKNLRQAALALALMAEEELYILNREILDCGYYSVSRTINSRADFSISEILPRIPELAEYDFCNPDKFLDKNNFGKMSKTECFAR